MYPDTLADRGRRASCDLMSCMTLQRSQDLKGRRRTGRSNTERLGLWIKLLDFFSKLNVIMCLFSSFSFVLLGPDIVW